MKKGDIFYIADPQTNTILEREVLDVVDGKVHYNFRDSVVQKCPIENMWDYHHKTLESAEQHMADFRKIQIESAEKQIRSLQNKIHRLNWTKPVVTKVVIKEYKELAKIGRNGIPTVAKSKP